VTTTSSQPAAAAPSLSQPRLRARRYGRSGHGYTLDGEKIDGVTSVLDALPKQLKQWAADTAANYAVEHWDELTGETLTKRLDRIRYAHRDVIGAAALRGKDIHTAGEAIVTGQAVEIPEELRGPAEAYARFLDLWGIEPVAIEATICNTTHRYGGRGDLWCRIGARGNAYAYVDIKTGKNIYESVVLQACAYDNADLWQPDGPDSEERYVPVDLVYVAHVLPDDVRMVPVRGVATPKPGPAEFRQFLYVQQTSRWLALHGFNGEEPLLEEAERP
jgi:hypothetical protein